MMTTQKLFESLPPIFQDRIHAFQEYDDEFDENFLGYETRACTAAVFLTEKFPTQGELESFSKRSLSYQEVPELEALNLSHNQVGFAIHMAATVLEHGDKFVVNVHGAMCPVAGCESYGCYAARKLR